LAGDSVARSKKFSNPFYGLLLVAGVLFVVTASAYGVMYVQEIHGTQSVGEHPLMVWLERYGDAALLAELALLAVGTFGAIGTDEYWQRRAKQREKEAAAFKR
jgi:hypothetical protein